MYLLDGKCECVKGRRATLEGLAHIRVIASLLPMKFEDGAANLRCPL